MPDGPPHAVIESRGGAPGEATSQAPASTPGVFRFLARVGTAYFNALVWLTLLVALASFVRDRGPVLTNISFWLLIIPFAAGLWSVRAGLVVATILLCVSASLHTQLKAVAGMDLRAWAYPGVDAAVGFIAAWTFRGGPKAAMPLVQNFPSGGLLALHAWIVFSAAIAIAHNLWQSASEFSLRGLVSMAWMLRWTTFQDDYFPLQDAFFYGIAIIATFASCTVLTQHGDRVFKAVVAAVLAGACANAAFAIWQHVTGKGWFAVTIPAIEVNALWPDIHSFGPFMAFALTVGVGLVLSRSLSLSQNVAVGVTLAAVSVGLYLSGSRSTLLIVSLLFAIGCVCAALRTRGWARAVPLLGAIVLFAVLHLALTQGIRGLTLDAMVTKLDTASLDVALSYRPEIWAAALRMYSEFPLFGLGQGAFYRLGSMRDFSGSETLATLGGSGAHNYFLQFVVELGPVGVLLALWVAVPFLRLGHRNLGLISFYGLVGIAIGNVYAHSLLVRETLMLAAIFGGMYLWEASRVIRESAVAPKSFLSARMVAVLGALLFVAAVADAATSFKREPFRYGVRCHEVRPIAWDGWTQGTLRVEVPAQAQSAKVTLLAERRDLSHRPVDVLVAIRQADGEKLAVQQLRFGGERRGPLDVSLSSGVPTGNKRFLEISTSNCYVPLNMGRGHDARHLGVRVTKLEFR
jgi:hypothetical protein